MIKYYFTEDRHVGRLQESKTTLSHAEVLRDGKWEATYPAELVWNARPITREQAVENLTTFVRATVTKEEAERLLDEESKEAAET